MREVIIFDEFGAGHSGGTMPSGIPQMAADVDRVLEAMGVQQVDLLGWSMGGAVAFTLTLLRPTKIRRLIVAASWPGSVAGVAGSTPEVQDVVSKPVNDLDDFLFLFFPHNSHCRDAGSASIARLNKRSEPALPTMSGTSVGAQGAALQAYFGADSVYARIPAISQPTLITDGMQDLLAPVGFSFQPPNESRMRS